MSRACVKVWLQETWEASELRTELFPNLSYEYSTEYRIKDRLWPFVCHEIVKVYSAQGIT
jgi:hypothetical protein